jgi:hypothetical protein
LREQKQFLEEDGPSDAGWGSEQGDVVAWLNAAF